MQAYLSATAIVNYHHPEVNRLARQLARQDAEATAKDCFEWVRDNIYHSSDHQMNPVTCSAADVLKHQTGYCFAKSHLLAALLRANSIPTGFCYQRLSVFNDGAPYSLHGFNGIYLQPYGWYRIDARGNKPGVNAQFTPPQEQLAFGINFPAEIDCQHVFSEPLPQIVRALAACRTWKEALDNLPDLEPENLLELSANHRQLF